MIIIKIYFTKYSISSGLSCYYTEDLAKCFHTTSDNILIQDICGEADAAGFTNNGDWQDEIHNLVEIKADRKYQQYEKEVADFLINTLKPYLMHITVLFSYMDGVYEYVNPDFPKLLTDENRYEGEKDPEYSNEDEYYFGRTMKKITPYDFKQIFKSPEEIKIAKEKAAKKSKK